MKKRLIPALLAVCVLVLSACGGKAVQTVEGNFKTYEKLSDGTWRADGHPYKYRLEISGRMPRAAKTSTFVYLSDLESISYEQAWKAAGFSSDLGDYVAPEDAVLVEIRVE